MKTVERLINNHGGLTALKEKSITAQAQGFMDLHIEYLGIGPRGKDTISVSHYYEQNGDLMRDPDMVFEIYTSPLGAMVFMPVSYQQDGLGLYQEACFKDEQGRIMIRSSLIKDLNAFAKQWDKILKQQGFLKTEGASDSKTPPPLSGQGQITAGAERNQL